VTYPPLAKVRQQLRVKWYRSPIDPARLRQLMQRSDLQGWLQAGGHLALFATTAALTWLLWQEQLWLGFALALFAHGTVASFLTGVAPHELAHGTVFRTKWLNRAFLYLFCLVSWWDPFDFCPSHTYHHRDTMYKEGDRENLLPLHPIVGPTFLLQMFTLNLMTRPGRTFGKGGLIATILVTASSALGLRGYPKAPIAEWLAALHVDQPREARKSVWWSRALLLFHAGVVVGGFALGLWVLPLLITVSAFLANWLSDVVGLTQHCGLADEVADFRKSTRSITLGPLATFLYWRMNWYTTFAMQNADGYAQSGFSGSN
jgi:fatty acid desaturase